MQPNFTLIEVAIQTCTPAGVQMYGLVKAWQEVSSITQISA